MSSTYNNTKELRFWCQKVLPLVYDDSLSYYELLNKIVVYLNSTIEDVQAMIADVTRIEQGLSSKIDLTQKGVANGVATLDGQGKVPLTQLPNISAGVQTISVNGVNVPADENKNVNIIVMTNAVSDLVNYYLKSETYSKTEVNTIIDNVKNSRFEVVAQLPTTDIQTNVIYLVPKSVGQTQNGYDEFININGTTSGWELIGSTDIDLSGYVTDSELATALSAYVTTQSLNTILTGYVTNGTLASTLESYVQSSTFNTLVGRVSNIEGVIPSNASSSNKMATANDINATNNLLNDTIGFETKNLIPFPYESDFPFISTGITATLNNDGSIRIQGTTNENEGNGIGFQMNETRHQFTVKGGRKYWFNSGGYYNTNARLWARFYYDAEHFDNEHSVMVKLDDAPKKEVDLTNYPTIYWFRVGFFIPSGVEGLTIDTTLYPMLTYNDESSYIPPTGYVENEISEINKNVLAGERLLKDTVGWTCKNKIPFPYHDTDKTQNGVTFTVNNDGSITADTNGLPSSGSAEFNLFTYEDNVSLPNGKYAIIDPTYNHYGNDSMYGENIFGRLSGGQEVGILSKYSNPKRVFEVDNSIQNEFRCKIYISAGMTLNNITFYPMICDAEIVDESYEKWHDTVENSSSGTSVIPNPSGTATGDLTKVQIGNDIYDIPNTTYGVVSKTANGLAPQLPNETTTEKYLRQDGAWVKPPNTEYSDATTSASGLMSATDKAKLNGIANNANNYSLPTASSDTKGGSKVGTGLAIANEILSVPALNYSTSEQIVGKWIDGSNIYQKTFTDTLPSATTDGTEVGGSNIAIGTTLKALIDAECVISTPGNNDQLLNIVFNPANTSGARFVVFNNSAGGNANTYKLYNSKTSWNSSTVRLTIRYTKP